MSRCEATFTLRRTQLRCDDEAGHSGEHRSQAGPTRISWSPKLQQYLAGAAADE